MTKTKLAVCIGDEEYQTRFVRCLINHYQSQFEVFVFCNLAEITDQDAQEYEVIIVGDCDKGQVEILAQRGENILFLSEEKEKNENEQAIVFVEKYQEVYKIIDCMERFTGKIVPSAERNKNKKRKLIGIYSLERELLQLPFAATLCNICAENESVLFINMQPYVRVEKSWETGVEQEILEMEDLMTVAATGVYTKGRLLAGIGREENWEYVHSVKNPESLSEGNYEIYCNMMDILSEELGYKTIVLNFGSVFSGMTKLMESCDSFYLLVSREDSISMREKLFVEAMENNEKTDFLRRVTRCEIPTVYSTDCEWRKLVEKWRWSELGAALQEELWMVEQGG